MPVWHATFSDFPPFLRLSFLFFSLSRNPLHADTKMSLELYLLLDVCLDTLVNIMATIKLYCWKVLVISWGKRRTERQKWVCFCIWYYRADAFNHRIMKEGSLIQCLIPPTFMLDSLGEKYKPCYIPSSKEFIGVSQTLCNCGKLNKHLEDAENTQLNKHSLPVFSFLGIRVHFFWWVR